MTKKDYVKAAEIVKNSVVMQDNGKEIWCPALYVRDAFIELFSGDNPRFDVERFKKACELP